MTDLLCLSYLSLRLRCYNMFLQSFALLSMSLSVFPLLYGMIGGVLYMFLADCVLSSILASRVV